MRIEKIGIGSTLLFALMHQCELVGNQLVGMVAVEHPRPKAYFPPHAPAGRRVTAMNERCSRRIEQFGRAERRNLIARIEAI